MKVLHSNLTLKSVYHNANQQDGDTKSPSNYRGTQILAIQCIIFNNGDAANQGGIFVGRYYVDKQKVNTHEH